MPLPEVNEQSDRIIIGDMGLPVGFDQERLLVHLPRLERIAHLAGMGTLTIAGFRGDTTEYGYSVGGVSEDGVGSAISSMVTTKAKIHESGAELDKRALPFPHRWHDGSVKINNAEIEDRIKNDGDKWEKGVFDEQARAKYMSDALQRGLVVAAGESTFPDKPLSDTLAISGLKKSACTMIWAYAFKTGVPEGFLLHTGFSTSFRLALSTLYPALTKKLLPPFKFSLAEHVFYDRYAAAQGLNMASRLVKAKK